MNLRKKKIRLKKKIHKPKKLTNTTIHRAEEQSFSPLTQSLTTGKANVILNHSSPCQWTRKAADLNQELMRTFVHSE